MLMRVFITIHFVFLVACGHLVILLTLEILLKIVCSYNLYDSIMTLTTVGSEIHWQAICTSNHIYISTYISMQS